MSKIDIFPFPFPFEENNNCNQSELNSDDPESSHNSDRLIKAGGELMKLSFADEDTSEPEEKDLKPSIAEKIIDVSLIPKMIATKDKPIIRMSIIGDRKLRVNGKEVELVGDQTFLFNALMLLRDEARSAREISKLRSAVDDPGSVDKLVTSETTRKMFNNFNTAAGTMLFKKVGKKGDIRYAVNPNLQISDRSDPNIRPHDNRKSAAPRTQQHILSRISFEESNNDPESTTIIEDDVLFVKLLKLYGNHPKVKLAEQRLRVRRATISPEFSLQRYFQEANQYKLLNGDEEKRLFGLLRKGIAILEKGEASTLEEENTLIEAAIAHRTIHLSNLKLAISRAKKYLGQNIDMLDLIQEANHGLFLAISRFDINKGFKFSTFAYYRIKDRLGRTVSDHSRLIRLPAHGHERWDTVRKHASAIEMNVGRLATIEEITESTGFKDVEDLLRMGSMKLRSLNEPLSDTADSDELSSIVSDPTSTDGFAAVESADSLAVISRIFKDADLTNLEVAVLSSRYRVYIPSLSGTEIKLLSKKTGEKIGSIPYDKLYSKTSDKDNVTYELIGSLMGVSRDIPRVAQVRAFEKLGQYLSENSKKYDGVL